MLILLSVFYLKIGLGGKILLLLHDTGGGKENESFSSISKISVQDSDLLRKVCRDLNGFLYFVKILL